MCMRLCVCVAVVVFQVAHTLQSVLLFDPLNSDFDITHVVKPNNGGGSLEKVAIQATAQQGIGFLLCHKMLPSDKLHVKVHLSTLPHVLSVSMHD